MMRFVNVVCNNVLTTVYYIFEIGLLIYAGNFPQMISTY